jgi:hypothetical protein
MSDQRYILTDIHPALTPEQRIALTRIMEEAAEVIKCATKIMRFGIVAEDRVVKGKMYDNNDDLMREMLDLMQANVDFQKAIP